MKALLVTIVIGWGVAAAGTTALVAHDAGAYSVSVPKGWTVVDNAAQGMVVAQQDPKRKDAAQLLVVVTTSGQATADQLLDAVMKNGLTDGKVVKREAIGDAGKLLIADGKVDGIAARLGAVAASNSSGAVLAVLIAKQSEFDALGGITTVASVIATLKLPGAPAAKPDATPPAVPAKSSAARDAVMKPTFDYGSLVIPPPARALELVDLVGTWTGDNAAGRTYASASGRGTAYSTSQTSDEWIIDAKGNVKDRFKSATVASEGPYTGVHGHENSSVGTLSVNANNTFVIHYPAQNGVAAKDEHYIIDGWFVGPEVTILEVQGPFYKPITADNLAHVKNNKCCMDREFVIQRKQP